MDANDVTGSDDQTQDPLPTVPEVPERPTASGWVIVKKARKPKAQAAPLKAAPTKAAPRKAAPARKKPSSSKRELIDTGRNKMYAKRGTKGRFKEMDDVGRSLSADRRKKAKTTTKSGHGDQGDGRRAKARGKKTAPRTAAKKTAAKKTAAKKTARKKVR